MARITCRTPSTGRPIHVVSNNITTTFQEIAEAPDFSVPDTSNRFPIRDPLDNTRAVRPGEIFFLTPLAIKNKDTQTRWVEVRLVTEDNVTIEVAKVYIPKEDTAFIPLQGRSIFKRLPNAVNGDRVLIRGEVDGVFDAWATGEQKLSNEHIGEE